MSRFQPEKAMPMREFIAMLGLIFATAAFSIDSMLPALPEIARTLSPDAVNRAQLIISAFVMGMGAGTLFAGPISDAIGRRRAINIGFTLYILASFAAIFADTLWLLLIARFVQGLGVSGPRIAGQALIRDLYQGRAMARISSLTMMIFMIVPAIAPSIGAVVIGLGGWHAIFVSFILFALCALIWFNLRQPETLPPERRRPLNLSTLWAGVKEVLSNREVMLCTLTLTLGFGQMMALISSAQQIFTDTYHQGAHFPLWFALMAVLATAGPVVNARLVGRLGMYRLARSAYLGQTLFSAGMLGLNMVVDLPQGVGFALFFIWAVGVFSMAGVTFGNLNAIAMQHMGHLAGMTASVVSAISTLASVLIAVPVGLSYDGTAIPLITATLICSAVAWAVMAGLMRETG